MYLLKKVLTFRKNSHLNRKVENGKAEANQNHAGGQIVVDSFYFSTSADSVWFLVFCFSGFLPKYKFSLRVNDFCTLCIPDIS